MLTETYHLNHPMHFTRRDGDRVTDTIVEKIEFERRDDGDCEPNVALVQSCAKVLFNADGGRAKIEDLLHLRVEEGVRRIAETAFASPGKAN